MWQGTRWFNLPRVYHTLHADNCLVSLVLNIPVPGFGLHTSWSVLTDHKTWLHAAGTRITHGRPQYCRESKRVKGGVGSGGGACKARESDKAMTEPTRKREKHHKIMEERNRGLLSWWGGGKAGVWDSLLNPAEMVQFHIITWEGQQRCSFTVDTFYAFYLTC